MRTTTAPELATLAATTRQETLRVKVENGSGTMIDLTSWVLGFSIDHDVDQPVGGATVSFVRASGTTQSLAPLRTDSTLNVDDTAAYAPILDLNRTITIEVATTDIGVAIVGGDYKMMFVGTIDIVNWEADPVSVSCRDGMAPLVDRWIEDPDFYGATPVGTDLEDVMEDIADDVLGVGVEPVYTPVSPAYAVIRYQQQEMSVADAWTDLVQLRGMDIREKWHDGTSSFRHTLYEPDRGKTTPDHTFAPSKYFIVSQLNIELTNIRNAVQVTFRDSTDLGNRNKVTVTDGPSITKYGRRFFRMQEADTSPIDTPSEATTMAGAALADLKDPKAEQEVEMPFFWPAELGDLYRYSDNLVHYNTNQDWAVVEIKHTFQKGRYRTTIKTRGTPIGQYATWLGRGGTGPGGGGAAFPPYPFISPRNTEADDSTWDLRFDSLYGSGGGGTNLAYTVKSKATFGTETTVSSGNASAFPLDLTITRDPKQDKVITLRVTDAATALFAETRFVVPAFVAGISATGTIIGSQIDVASVGPTQTEARFNAKVFHSTTQSIATGTGLTILAFDSEIYDVGVMHDPSTNNSRLTIPAGGGSGNWLVNATIVFASNATGYREVEILRNGAFIMARSRVAAVNGAETIVSVTGIADFPTAADYFEVGVAQTSGVSINVQSDSVFSAIYLW